MALGGLLTNLGFRSEEKDPEKNGDVSITGGLLGRIQQSILTGGNELLKFGPLKELEVPGENAPSVQEAILKERMLLQRQKNRRSTILTGSQGVSATEPLQKALG